MISAIAVDGPGVDAAAADKHDVNQVTGLSKAAACGAPGPNWDPIEGITAAGFKKFTAEQEIKGVEGEQQALYATHCFAVDGGTITMQLPVVPKARLRVVLHFAEVFFEERGLRTFDVVVNGVPQVRDHYSQLRNCMFRSHNSTRSQSASTSSVVTAVQCVELRTVSEITLHYVTCSSSSWISWQKQAHSHP